MSFDSEEGAVDSKDAARIDLLTQTLQVDPANDAVVDELVELLSKADRGHDLLALLSSQLEDASPERRSALAPKTRIVLTRLADDAEAKGRTMEAQLFRDAIEIMTSS